MCVTHKKCTAVFAYTAVVMLLFYSTGKSKGEVVLRRAMQAYKGSGGRAPLNLNLGTR